MAFASGSPLGDFYQGYSEGISPTAEVNYSSKVFVTTVPSTLVPYATTQIFKWLLVQQDGFERRFGVNTIVPSRISEIKSNMSTDPQLRLTTNNNAWVDFLTNTSGNLQIQPMDGRVGVNANANPTATLDVFGNARIRNVQAETPNSILIGVNANGPSDVNVRRLDFTGNNNQVLLGNGTWGTLPPTNPPVTLPGANNGVSRFTLFGGNAPYRLGDEYTNIFPIFNTNTPLTVDRQVRLNGKNFVFSDEGRVGIGLNSYFDNNVPLTMLHLEGQNNTSFDGGQFRAWMRTGMFARENSDAMYVGLKSEGFNRADMIVDLSNSKVLVKIK